MSLFQPRLLVVGTAAAAVALPGQFVGRFTTPAELSESFNVVAPQPLKPLLMHHLLRQPDWRRSLVLVNWNEVAHQLELPLSVVGARVTLQLKHGSLVVASSSGGVVATHPVLQLSHFSQTVADPRCFLYFVRGAQAGSHAMYLYQLRDKDMVSTRRSRPRLMHLYQLRDKDMVSTRRSRPRLMYLYQLRDKDMVSTRRSRPRLMYLYQLRDKDMVSTRRSRPRLMYLYQLRDKDMIREPHLFPSFQKSGK
ncbi:putative ATP-dependent RNA helicase Dbp73D [Amphibalanus amphitrite]|uniref:Putative ATP-dependent RNA helicase Dbp73D n=1 Tax=Amphibalanus amphitrite TaxID=1232801 RepID=A0A6A4WSV0_AMPAM|nr:putative ATP-dependent RNA helicase Dbp73D [Amphibalanus amphitrite]